MDGLRAVAIVLVMLFHAQVPGFSGGFIGVDVFFTLSGYLITSLLIVEFRETGRIDVRWFYIRRLLRLTPALFVMLLTYVAISPLAWSDGANHFQQAAVAMAYLSDYGVAFWGVPSHISHTWSLAVEEHYYVIWPLILVISLKHCQPRRLFVLLFLAYIFSIVWRWAWIESGQTWNQVYYRFDTHLSGLLLGASLAAGMQVSAIYSFLASHKKYFIWLPLISIITLQYQWGDYWMLIHGIGLAEWSTAAILLAISQRQGMVFDVLSTAILNWIGRLSYSLYLWHFPIFLFLRKNHDWIYVLQVGMPIAITLAAASYYTVELWVLRYRERRQNQMKEPGSGGGSRR